MSSRVFDCSPLALADDAVGRLSQPPRPFTLDAAALGIQDGSTELTVPQLREVLASPGTQIVVKNRAWGQLITRAQREHPTRRYEHRYTLAAIGVALPGLRAVTSQLASGDTGSRAELETEILAGFLTALARARTPSQQRFPVLLRAAHRAGLAWCSHCRLAPLPVGDTTTDTSRDTGGDTVAATPCVRLVGTVAAHTAGHPDTVLADAVRAGILTRGEADLIGATRLERRPLRLVAAEHGVTANTVWMRRNRAEKRLIAALTHTLGAQDSDHAENPTTDGHLLATTSLTPRLTRPARRGTATPEPRSATPPPPRVTRPIQLINPVGDTPVRTPPATATADPATDLPGHDRRGHDIPGHQARGHGQPVHGRRLAPDTGGGQPPAGHHDRGHAPAGRSGCRHRQGQTPTSDTTARPATTIGSTVSQPAGSRVRGGAADRPDTSRPRDRLTTAAREPRTRLPVMPVLVLVLMLLTGNLTAERQGSAYSTATASASRLTPTLTSLPTPHAITTATMTTAAALTPLPTPHLSPSSTPVCETRPAPTTTLHSHDALAQVSPVNGVRRPTVPAVALVAAPTDTGGASGTDGTAQLTRVLTNIRNWLMGLLITLATVCLTIGGVRYLLAGGDPGEVEAAKRAIKSAAIGYALAVLAPALVAVLRNLVGL